MFKSLYSYRGTHARTISFESGQQFLEIGASKDPNWVHVIGDEGNLGYVPGNYVAKVEASPHDMLEMIDACIEGIHLAASDRGGNCSRSEHQALEILVVLRQEWHAKAPPYSHPSKRHAPPPPSSTSNSGVDYCENESSPSSLIPSMLTPSNPPSSVSANCQELASEVTTSFMGRGNSLALDDVESKTDQSHLPKQPVQIDQNSVKNIDICGKLKIPKGYNRQLVEQVRQDTNINYSASQKAVTTILQSLGFTFPIFQPLLDKILKEESPEASTTMGISLPWQSSNDGKYLVELFESLRQLKDDDQQRSWALHEDEGQISKILDNVSDVLTNGDIEVCRCIVQMDDCLPILTLVQFYQMETRWSLRKLMLGLFATVCQMDRRCVSYLVASVLPLELAREILDTNTDIERLEYISLVLGMVLSMGDTLPVPHFEIMDESFIKILLDGVEKYYEESGMENLGELYLTLILAFNLQFHSSPSSSHFKNDLKQLNGEFPQNRTLKNEISDIENSRKKISDMKISSNCDMPPKIENLFVKVLTNQEHTKYIVEKILLLFNREEDPVSMFGHSPPAAHSVIAAMKDIFSTENTAQLLYTNDERVVCDILLRQLTDLPPDDLKRNDYLCILNGVLRDGKWKEHRHLSVEFRRKLKSISIEVDTGNECCGVDVSRVDNYDDLGDARLAKVILEVIENCDR